jgi:type VI protein secretion system component VasK
MEKRSTYLDKFENLFAMFMSTSSIALAIYALYYAEGKPMNTLISAIVCGILAILIFIYSIYCLIKMNKLPKEPEKKQLPDIKRMTDQIDELKKLRADLNEFFEHLDSKEK